FFLGHSEPSFTASQLIEVHSGLCQPGARLHDNGLPRTSQVLAAARHSAQLYVGFGSFTSFPPSRRVRFAPRPDIRPMSAFMTSGPHAARTPGVSMALTPSTTHGGHPASRSAPVTATRRGARPGRRLIKDQANPRPLA